jgi:hypothetical protein
MTKNSIFELFTKPSLLFISPVVTGAFALELQGRINDSVKRRREKINIIGCVFFEFFISTVTPDKTRLSF